MNNSEFEKLIIDIADFPKAGVTFKDISPLLDKKLDEVITAMGSRIDWSNIDAIVGIESRGFILGAAMAIKFKKGFIPMRKKGKLPPPVVSETYDLEYGSDQLELKLNSVTKRVVLVDDVLATGGTLKAAINLCEKNNYSIQAISMLIDLAFLNNMSKESDIIHSVLSYK